METWGGICRAKTNPLREIRRNIEDWHFRRDLQEVLETRCLYTDLLVKPTLDSRKKYCLEPFFKKMGRFRNAECRKLFIFALLDPCRFERTCPQCFGKHKDIISHVLTACVNVGDLR